MTVTNNNITGTLKYLSSGQLVTDWGAGNFLALAFSDIGDDITSVKVGMDPSQSSGLVELINDPDKMGVFKVTNKDINNTREIWYNLDGLICETA